MVIKIKLSSETNAWLKFVSLPLSARLSEFKMQRWWYSDGKNDDIDKTYKHKKSSSKRIEGMKKWKFSVLVHVDLNLYENVALTGSCDELGAWDNNSSILLNKEEGEIQRNIRFTLDNS